MTGMGPTTAMDNVRCRGFCLLLLLLIVSPLLNSSPVVFGGDGRLGGEEAELKQGLSPVERAIGVTTAALNSRWDAVRNWAKLTWMNLRPPASRSGSSAGGVVMDAATRSFKTSKETVEKAARSAAEVADEALDKTKEKVKRTVSNPGVGDPDAEL